MLFRSPSNFIRVLEIFHHQFPELQKNLSSFSFTDEETLVSIREVYNRYNYLLDPHGAVGYLALQKYLSCHAGTNARLSGGQGIFLETAHAVKFPEAVERATGKKIDIPASIASLMQYEKKSMKMAADYTMFREYLIN